MPQHLTPSASPHGATNALPPMRTNPVQPNDLHENGLLKAVRIYSHRRGENRPAGLGASNPHRAVADDSRRRADRAQRNFHPIHTGAISVGCICQHGCQQLPHSR